MTSFYASLSSLAESSALWYNDAELARFTPEAYEGRGGTATTSLVSRPATGGHPSFYGNGPGGFRFQRPAAPVPTQGGRQPARGSETTGSSLAARDVDPEMVVHLAGDSVSVLPKRPPRWAGCPALDKEIAACKVPGEVLALATGNASVMDAANWANLIYALAHLAKHGAASGNGDRIPPAWVSTDPRWWQSCQTLQSQLPELTARDTANVLWSLVTLTCSPTAPTSRYSPLFLEAASALCDKLSVCDPISVSKAAWALTSVPSRDKRLDLFTHLAVPVVLRAEVFPIGALTMTCYAFAKAAHRDANVYEALSSAIARYPDDDLRPIDVCNVVWAFCTVGYRDDLMFDRICDAHLTDAEGLKSYNAQDLSNTMWGFSKVAYTHGLAMEALAHEGIRQRDLFKPIHFTNFFYSFATLRLRGPEGFLSTMADAAVSNIRSFDSGNLSVIVWALAQLRERHVLLDSALEEVLRPDVCRTLSSRTLSMLFLAFFRFDRVPDVDSIFDRAISFGTPICSSGFSAVIMTAEQGDDSAREVRLLQSLADEAADERMRATIRNAAVIRLVKRQRLSEARRLLQDMHAAAPRGWSAVSSRLYSRLFPDEPPLEGARELWEAPVKSGIHPIAATRQNEGPHAYTREFMSLQAALCSAPGGDPDACMVAVEQFAESRSLWLKITAWEKAVVVHEVARLRRPRLTIEIGAYIGYSATNLARAVRPHGGRVASIEVDPVHVAVVRNMVEYAGLTDTVDVWTGYCYDVIPHLLEAYGPASVDMVFMDQKGTRFHTDLELMENLGLLADGAVVLADNVLKPGAPLYIWHLAYGPYEGLTAVSVREFLLQSEDWMVLGFHDASRGPTQAPPPDLHRLAFESDAFRKRSMFDSIAPSKSDWWAFSQRFVNGLDRCGAKPRIVGLHGRDNPTIQPADIAGIFRDAGRFPPLATVFF